MDAALKSEICIKGSQIYALILLHLKLTMKVWQLNTDKQNI